MHETDPAKIEALKGGWVNQYSTPWGAAHTAAAASLPLDRWKLQAVNRATQPFFFLCCGHIFLGIQQE